MTPSVADKTPIPAKVWRRHTDPPGLWISVVIASLSLHLLAFWLMRSSNAFSLWFPQQSQSAVPIQLIDIAPETKSIIKSKSTVKTVSSKPLSTTPKSVVARSSQTARTPTKNQDIGAIDSADNLQQKRRTYASKPNSKPLRKQSVSTPTPTPIPTPTPTLTPIVRPTFPVGNLPWNRRQQIKLGQGTLLPKGIPSNSPVSEAENRQTPATPNRETPATPNRETPATPNRETPATPNRETPATPNGETPATPSKGASVAIVAPLLRNEVSNLIKLGRLRQDALPDVIALYRGSNTKQLDSSFIVQNSGLEPAEILASLIIDNNGNFQQAVVIEIQPGKLQSEKSTYEQVLSEVFKTEKFIAAYNNNGTKPELSNLYVRIKIQSAISN